MARYLCRASASGAGLEVPVFGRWGVRVALGACASSLVSVHRTVRSGLEVCVGVAVESRFRTSRHAVWTPIPWGPDCRWSLSVRLCTQVVGAQRRPFQIGAGDTDFALPWVLRARRLNRSRPSVCSSWRRSPRCSRSTHSRRSQRASRDAVGPDRRQTYDSAHMLIHMGVAWLTHGHGRISSPMETASDAEGTQEC